MPQGNPNSGSGNSDHLQDFLDEDDVLKDKMIDDFNVSALKHTMFSKEVVRKRDIDTFFNRVYYDNFGSYGIYDEKTYQELKHNESQYNSVDQLIKALNNTVAT